ncbi:unnamed protein product [Arctia plantaginis]|uniref:Peptidase S1 domain-containing protein n=1 Tax=Arctia plantaginis TaxID=874455 RepID=A0A8S0YLF2_ARCPL|nr:unnamed protein product [Arctia plantaginis]
MPQGIETDAGRFPWLGIVQHGFNVGDKRFYVISGAVLIHPVFAIAGAEDIAKIDPVMLVNNTELIFWKSAKKKIAITVQDYTLHPEFESGTTVASIALLSIMHPLVSEFSEVIAPVRPICMPLSGIGSYADMYAVKITDELGDLQKEVFKMDIVDKKQCEDFYIQSELNHPKMIPTNPFCAVSTNSKSACIWDSGTALITRQSWGFYQLIGFAVRGPGCAAPTKFLHIMDYMPWINDLIQIAASQDYSEAENDEGLTIGFRRLSPTSLVFYPISQTFPRYIGVCDVNERGRTLYKDIAEITATGNVATGYYLVSVTQDASFYCGEIFLKVNRRTNAVMWVENHSHRAMEGMTYHQERTGSLEELECFVYFRSTAYIEFKFIFSYSAFLYVVLYGKLDKTGFYHPYKSHPTTTSWWPTHKLEMSKFTPADRPYWSLRVIKLVEIMYFSVNKSGCSVWEKLPCAPDEKHFMPEGIEKDTGRFPWLGIIQYGFTVGDKRIYAISGVVLIHSLYAISAAEDLAKIDRTMLENNTELIFWKTADYKVAAPVKDYILHPEFEGEITSATLALVSMVHPFETDFNEFIAPVKPVCMPLSGIGTYNDMYVVKFTDVTGELQKEVYKMKPIDKNECDNFYVHRQLHYDKMNPTNPLCAASFNATSACVWDSGTALISRQSWGFWQLLGFGVRGPGCAAPTKFLNLIDYIAWINDIIQSAPFQDIYDDKNQEGLTLGLRRLSPTRLIFYPVTAVLPRYLGDCHVDERGRTLYRDQSQIASNTHFAQAYYLVSVTQDASFHCGEINLRVGQRTNAVMWVENHCHRAMEGMVYHQAKTGWLEELECFIYFKSTAYLEFKFTFSFKAEITIVMYGKLDEPGFHHPYRRRPITTSWWPTHTLNMGLFVPSYRPFWRL